MSAMLAAASPISGRLPRSRSPPAPNTQRSRAHPPADRPRAAPAPLSARSEASPAYGRSPREPRSPGPPPPAQTDPGRVRRGPSASTSASSSPPIACTAARAAERVGDVEASRHPQRHVSLPRGRVQAEAASLECAAHPARSIVGLLVLQAECQGTVELRGEPPSVESRPCSPRSRPAGNPLPPRTAAAWPGSSPPSSRGSRDDRG